MPAATFDAVPGVTTFLVGEQREAVLATLAGLGFELGPTTTTVTTLLDTFDGRVHRAGLRLTVTESEADHVVVELSGRDTPPGRVRFDVVPQLPSDLPPGPLRSRIESVIDIRAVSPQLRVTATQIDGTVRDEAGKTVAAMGFVARTNAAMILPSIAATFDVSIPDSFMNCNASSAW